MGYVTTYFGDVSLSRRVWDEARPIFPHRCLFTGKWIMPGRKSVRSRMIGFDGKPGNIFYMEYTVYWTTPENLVMYKLKGNV